LEEDHSIEDGSLKTAEGEERYKVLKAAERAGCRQGTLGAGGKTLY